MATTAKTPLEKFSVVLDLPGAPSEMAESTSGLTMPAAPAVSREEIRTTSGSSRKLGRATPDILGAAYQLTYGCHPPGDVRAYWYWRLGIDMRLEVAIRAIREAAASPSRVTWQPVAAPIDNGHLDWGNLGPFDVLSTAYRRILGGKPSPFFALACLRKCVGLRPSAYDILLAVDRYHSSLTPRPQHARQASALKCFLAPRRLRRRFSDAELWADISKIEMHLELADLRDSVRVLSTAVSGAVLRPSLES